MFISIILEQQPELKKMSEWDPDFNPEQLATDLETIDKLFKRYDLCTKEVRARLLAKKDSRYVTRWPETNLLGMYLWF